MHLGVCCVTALPHLCYSDRRDQVVSIKGSICGMADEEAGRVFAY